jgi:hypothetical protein
LHSSVVKTLARLNQLRNFRFSTPFQHNSSVQKHWGLA